MGRAIWGGERRGEERGGCALIEGQPGRVRVGPPRKRSVVEIEGVACQLRLRCAARLFPFSLCIREDRSDGLPPDAALRLQGDGDGRIGCASGSRSIWEEGGPGSRVVLGGGVTVLTFWAFDLSQELIGSMEPVLCRLIGFFFWGYRNRSTPYPTLID